MTTQVLAHRAGRLRRAISFLGRSVDGWVGALGSPPAWWALSWRSRSEVVGDRNGWGGLAVLEVSPRLGLDRELHPAASMSHRLPLDSANIKPRS